MIPKIYIKCKPAYVDDKRYVKAQKHNLVLLHLFDTVQTSFTVDTTLVRCRRCGITLHMPNRQMQTSDYNQARAVQQAMRKGGYTPLPLSKINLG